MVHASPILLADFLVTVAVTLVGFLLLARRAGGGAFAARTGASLALWMLLTYCLAYAGVLRFGPMPPPMVGVAATALIATIWLALSGFGDTMLKAPMFALLGFQAFRILVELVLHRAYDEALIPVQMTYLGRNFDIITGVTAMLLAWLLSNGRAGKMWLWVWNIVGLGLLINIIVIAVRSTPIFGGFPGQPLNVWVTHAPWIWLPAFLVPMALFGHVLVFRHLARGR